MKRTFTLLFGTVILLVCFTGCGHVNKLSSKDPITLTMWHNYGGEMQATMDYLIDEFNTTVGKEQGIVIDVTAIFSSAELNKSLTIILNDDPGAPDMPDIFTGYPKIAVQFLEKQKLASLDRYFSEQELSAYVDTFLEEGRLSDGKLYVFPLAKSTEILYLNQTLFDRFSVETGVCAQKLSTFEGICELSKQYYEWTDAQTPDVKNDGKQFFTADSWFNIAEVGMKQLGSEMFSSEKLNLNNKAYEHIFNTLYTPAVQGGIALYNGYSSDLSKTGDLVCSTGSSAGILFYGDTITYPNGKVEQVEYSILPYPVFEGGKKIALRRGGGLMVAKSDEQKEYAATVFLKWLTASEQNMKFISKTGYLPVTKQAFEQDMQAHLKSVEDIRITNMLTAVLSMYDSYTFFTAPNFSSFDKISKDYEEQFKTLLMEQRSAFLAGKDVSVKETLEKMK